MSKLKVVAIIPARMASSRFPGKPLARILDLPMVEHVRRRTLLANSVDEVVVATCDQEIADVVTKAGGKAVMTSNTHERAVERVAEAAVQVTADVIVVVQGDEPLIEPGTVKLTVAPFIDSNEIVCVSLLSPLESNADYSNSNIVKAACDQNGYVLYLSRSPIPYYQQNGSCPIYRETGIRAFRTDFLQTYAALPETPFECVESVDLMRVLEHGYKIFGVPTEYFTIGVDHAFDVPIVENILRTNPAQRSLHRKIDDVVTR
ncbi:MAG: 3-deoxy-manno-octulosonate cytidylyltransferase [Candidatus Poribacteria bacterium]|nr:3-deoxy-manno-octulosonate cytidylyltransferase [Candidatus Poribacteria bacterium]